MSRHTEITSLLSDYGATLRSEDVEILRKLQSFEKTEKFDLSKFCPFVWGVEGLKKYNQLNLQGPSLWNRPEPDDVLNLIDDNLMFKSSRLLPLELKLDLNSSENSTNFFNQPLYDPRFFLPLFSYLMAPENVVNCKKFVQKNCLAFCFSCLACHDGVLRRCAYVVLAKFSKYLSAYSSKFDEKPQLQYLLNVFRNSLEKPNVRLSSIMAIFLGRASKLIFYTFDRMYSSVTSFLLLKPCLDLENVPEFYKFFHSCNSEFIHERRWMLQLMLDGLREPKDYRIYEKRYVFKLFLAFYNCSLSDEKCRELIAKIVKKATRMKVCCADLCFNHNLIGWISTNIENRTKFEFSTMIILIEILLVVGETLKDEDKSFRVIKTSWLATFCTFLNVAVEEKNHEKIDENFRRRLFDFANFILKDFNSYETTFVKRLMDDFVKN